jgi:hypothetical protein
LGISREGLSEGIACIWGEADLKPSPRNRLSVNVTVAASKNFSTIAAPSSSPHFPIAERIVPQATTLDFQNTPEVYCHAFNIPFTLQERYQKPMKI